MGRSILATPAIFKACVRLYEYLSPEHVKSQPIYWLASAEKRQLNTSPNGLISKEILATATNESTSSFIFDSIL